MDVNNFIEHGGVLVRNPNYTKTNGQPKYIHSIDPENDYLSNAFKGVSTLGFVYNDPLEKAAMEYGITPSKLHTERQDYAAILAETQSNWAKAGNAIAQTLVSELLLGIPKGFSDIFDFAINTIVSVATKEDNDYTNPVSQLLENAQESFNQATPIYTTPGTSIDNGGLADVGWWMSNIPSIASSLTLMIPARAATGGISKLSKLMKLTNAGRKASIQGRRWLGSVMRGQTNLAKAETYAKYGFEGALMRIAENYQESRQTYNDLYPMAYESLEGMTPEEYQNYIDTHRDILGNDIDYNDKTAVAKRIASRGADETFKSDMINGIFDIYQLYSLRNIGHIMNAPGRASVRRLDKLSRKFPTKSREELQKILDSRTKLQKAWDFTGDAARGSLTAITSEFTEGIEEAVNYAAQQEGLTYGQALLKKGFDEATGTYNLSDEEKENLRDKGLLSKDRLLPFSRLTSEALSNYAAAPELHDAAFWGILGGITFTAGGSGINRISQAYEAYNIKKDLIKQGVDKDQIPKYLELLQNSEIQNRLNNIEGRYTKWEELKNKIKTITDSHLDPYNSNKVLNTPEEHNLAIKRAIEDHDINLLLTSMDVGHWGITKAYLESDAFRDALVDSGFMTSSEAIARQTQIKTLANRIEKLYDKNVKIIDNALSRYSDDNKDLSDIPIEVFGLVARYNIQHQITADRLQENINILQTATNEEAKDKEKYLEQQGLNAKQIVTSRVQAQALGELIAERRDLAKSKEAATLSGQMILSKLDSRIKAITRELTKNIENVKDYARLIDSLNLAYSVVKDGDTYAINTDNEDFIRFNTAFMEDDENILKTLGVPNLAYKHTSQDFTQALELHRNAVKILYNTDKNRVISNLEDVSKLLYNNYHELAALELNRVVELSEIAVTKEDVAKRVDSINNFMTNTARHDFLDLALEGLQRFAQKYGETNTINAVLALQDGQIDKTFYNKLTSDEKRFFDNYVKLMALDKSVNYNLGERTINAIRLNNIYEFSTGEDIFSRATADTEKSSTSEKSISERKTEQPITTSDKDKTSLTFNETKKIEEKEEQETTKAKTAKVKVATDLNDTNPTGLKLITVEEDEDGVDALEDEEGNSTLDYINANPETIEDWIKDGNDFFDKEGNKSKNFEITKNPVVKRTDTGIEVIEKGTITYADSSTGEDTKLPKKERKDKTDKTEEGDEAYRAAEISSDDLGPEMAEEIINYIVSNDTYNYNDVATHLRTVFKDRDQNRVESLLEKFIVDNAELAVAANRNVEAVPIAKAVMFSNIEDVINDENNKEKVKEALNKTFEEILANYAKHSALDFDSINDKYILSLENLLRYCTDVTENKNDAHRLYSIFETIINNSNKYVIIDKTTPTAELIENAKKDYEKRKEELADAHNATSINVKRYVGRLLIRLKDKNTSEGDKQSIKANLEAIYDALDNAKPGDKLMHVNQSGNNQTGIDFFIVNSKGIAVKVGEIPTPKSVNGGTHWEMNNRGWRTDIPKSNGFSKFQKVITRILVPEENDSVGKEINKLLREYIIGKDNKRIEKAIIDLIRSDEELAERLTDENYENSDKNRVEHLVDLYNYVKQINDMFLQKYNLTREQVEEARRGNRIQSIQNWINKLKVSYNNAEYLKNAPDVPLEIQSIAEGNPIRTDTQRPVSKAIGADHKGLVHIGIVTFENPQEITIAGGTSIKNNFGKVGTPILTIGGGAHGSVAQIQVTTQSLNSPNFKNNKVIKDIINDVMSELETKLDSWGASHSSDELLDFIRKLVDRRYEDNVPLFQGVSVEPLTGEFNGFQLTYVTEDGNTRFIKFFNSVKRNDRTYAVSNVEFVTKNQATKARGISLSPKTLDKKERTKAIETIKKHLEESLRFNIDFAYINSDNDNIPLNGFATRKNGKFVINITGNKEYTFNSFNDFILDNDVINAATEPNAHGRNFNRPGEGGFMDSNGLTYAIVTNTNDTSPVEKIMTTATPYRKRGDEIVELVSNYTTTNLFGELTADTNVNLSKKILEVLLKDKQLNILNNSGIIKKLLHKNIIFVPDYNGLKYVENDGEEKTVPDTVKAAYHKDSVTYTRPDGTTITIAADTIVITPEWVKLANGTLEEQEKAVRDIIHENVHRVLTYPENSGWNEQAKEILNEFKQAKLEDKNDITVQKVYSNLSTEEFLVESITRPELMKVLNKISTGETIGDKVKLKGKNLLQKILQFIGNLFGIDVNKNSLLEKEYRLFEELGKTAKETVITEQQSDTTEQIKKDKNIQKTEDKILNEVENDDNGYDETVDFSSIDDVTVASKESIENTLDDTTKEWFNVAMYNGIVSITC